MLTDKQDKFIECLLQGMTDRQAYYVAYPNSKSWSENAVDVNACRLKKNTKVKLRLDALREEITRKKTDKIVVSVEKVLEQLGRISFANYKDLYDENGRPRPINELPDELGSALAAVDTTVDGAGNVYYKYRLQSKDKSLALLAQILGMLVPKETTEVKPIEVHIDYGDDRV